MKMFFSILLFAMPTLSFAITGNEFAIKQLLLDRNRAVVSFTTDSLAIGTDLVATFANGSQCALKVIVVKKSFANVDTSACKQAGDLKVGQKLELSLAVEEEKAEQAAPTSAEKPVPAPVTSPLAEVKPEVKQAFTDLQYQPPSGQFVVGLSYEMDKQSTSGINVATSQNISTGQDTLSGVSGLLGYGITNAIAIGVRYNYVLSEQNNLTYGAGSTLNGQTRNYTSKGAKDPAFYGQIRLLDQNQYPIILDFQVGYSPKTNNSVTATTLNNGNETRGGDATELTVLLGRKYSQFSYGFNLAYDFFGAGTANNPDTNVSTQNTAYSQFSLTASGQFKTSEQITLQGSIVQALISTASSSTPGSATISTANYSTTNLGASIIWTLVPNRVAFSFGLSSILPVDVKLTSGTTNITETFSSTNFKLGALATF